MSIIRGYKNALLCLFHEPPNNLIRMQLRFRIKRTALAFKANAVLW